MLSANVIFRDKLEPQQTYWNVVRESEAVYEEILKKTVLPAIAAKIAELMKFTILPGGPEK
jgi:hypothetical protein